MQFFGEKILCSEYVYGTGCDILDMSRVQKLDERKKDILARRILSDDEYEEYVISADKDRFLAVRFSVKESISKALKTGFRGFSMKDITVKKTSLGAPYAVFSGKLATQAEKMGIYTTEISVSHDGGFVMSTAVALKK
ncbi:MAG: holo-[acyl-carrier-protein] synthase [Anaerofustis stercorihominis]|nr:holo-[acyl-carrier-protein] synthase [Anaerofustis stercorihominis]